MLTQRTQPIELRVAPSKSARTSIDVLGVRATTEMLVQAKQRGEFTMADVTFVATSIPGSYGCPVLSGSWYSDATIRPAYKSRGISNDTTAIDLGDIVVDGSAGDARRACIGFEMLKECTGRDETPGASIAGAVIVERLMDGRTEVCVKMALALERARA